MREALLPEDAEAVLNMRRRGKNLVDTIIWNQDPKGAFTVKSAYHLARNISLNPRASESDSSLTKAVWRSIWNANCIPRAKIITWKILKDIIPTKVNIYKKRRGL